jgi:hypothetical protein
MIDPKGMAAEDSDPGKKKKKDDETPPPGFVGMEAGGGVTVRAPYEPFDFSAIHWDNQKAQMGWEDFREDLSGSGSRSSNYDVNRKNQIADSGPRGGDALYNGPYYFVNDEPRVVGGDIPFLPGPGSAKNVYTLYRAISKEGRVYWGITKDIVRRTRQHGDRFPNGLKEVYTNLSKEAARGLEQLKIDQFGLKKLDNAINSIGTNNPKIAEYYREAIRYLRELK